MCNGYNVTTTQDAIRNFVSATHDLIGNMEPSIDVFPDRFAPIVRNNEDRRELAMIRWGMPSSSRALFDAATKRADKLRARGKEFDFNELLKMEPDGGTTNIRNTSSQHWKRWLGVQSRCVVPFTRFAEPDPANKVEGTRTPNAWFASSGDDPLMFFAGLWVRDWTSVRKVKEGLVTLDLRVPDHGTERRRCADPSEGHAGGPDHEGRNRDLANRSLGADQVVATTSPGRLVEDRAGCGRRRMTGRPHDRRH